MLKFPEDGLNDEYKLFSGTNCAECDRVDLFYRSEVARIYPSNNHVAGVARSYVINNFPSPQFSLGAVEYNITVEAFQDLKKVNELIYTIASLEIASC